MYLAVYAEINLLSILILCMIYHKTRTNIDQQAAIRRSLDLCRHRQHPGFMQW